MDSLSEPEPVRAREIASKPSVCQHRRRTPCNTTPPSLTTHHYNPSTRIAPAFTHTPLSRIHHRPRRRDTHCRPRPTTPASTTTRPTPILLHVRRPPALPCCDCNRSTHPLHRPPSSRLTVSRDLRIACARLISSPFAQPRPSKWRQKYACSTIRRLSKPLALRRVRLCNAGV